MSFANRWNCGAAAANTLAACIVFLVGYGAAIAGESTNQARGKKLYEFYCYQCHGYSGDARTVAAAYLTPKPRDFSRTRPETLPREQMLEAVRHGKPGTAMVSFARVLKSEDMAAVVDYIRSDLMGSRRPELAYHTPANGWKNHQRYEPAFAFALGTLAIDTDWQDLSPTQRVGKKLFLSACITCHEPHRARDEQLQFEPSAVSYPRSTDTCVDCHAARPPELLPLSPAQPQALFEGDSSAHFAEQFLASPYRNHVRPAPTRKLSESEARGKDLFLENCAFCHAADGSSRNWIGSFLQPRPRDLRPGAMQAVRSASGLAEIIRNGVPGTSMPAWRAVLRESEIADLVAFLTHGQNMPSGRDSVAGPGALQTTDSPLQWTRRDHADSK